MSGRGDSDDDGSSNCSELKSIQAFVAARRLGGSGKRVDVELKNGERLTVAEKTLKPLNRASLKRVVADLTLLYATLAIPS